MIYFWLISSYLPVHAVEDDGLWANKENAWSSNGTQLMCTYPAPMLLGERSFVMLAWIRCGGDKLGAYAFQYQHLIYEHNFQSLNILECSSHHKTRTLWHDITCSPSLQICHLMDQLHVIQYSLLLLVCLHSCILPSISDTNFPTSRLLIVLWTSLIILKLKAVKFPLIPTLSIVGLEETLQHCLLLQPF